MDMSTYLQRMLFESEYRTPTKYCRGKIDDKLPALRFTQYYQGAKCLLRALRSNTALTKLDLRWNGVGNDGARAVRDILDTNRSLASVNLSGNKVIQLHSSCK